MCLLSPGHRQQRPQFEILTATFHAHVLSDMFFLLKVTRIVYVLAVSIGEQLRRRLPRRCYSVCTCSQRDAGGRIQRKQRQGDHEADVEPHLRRQVVLHKRQL